MERYITKRYDIYNTKILAVETELEKYQFKIDKILKNIENKINDIIQKRKYDTGISAEYARYRRLLLHSQ